MSMLKRLDFAEKVCRFTAITIAIPTLAALCGHDADRPLVLALLAVMFLLAFIASRLHKRVQAIKLDEHEKLPINAVKVEVVKRRVGYRYSSAGKSGVRSGPPLYYVTFKTKHGASLELYVSREVYFAASEGKRGILRHKGNEFISFN